MFCEAAQDRPKHRDKAAKSCHALQGLLGRVCDRGSVELPLSVIESLELLHMLGPFHRNGPHIPKYHMPVGHAQKQCRFEARDTRLFLSFSTPLATCSSASGLRRYPSKAPCKGFDEAVPGIQWGHRLQQHYPPPPSAPPCQLPPHVVPQRAGERQMNGNKHLGEVRFVCAVSLRLLATCYILLASSSRRAERREQLHRRLQRTLHPNCFKAP